MKLTNLIWVLALAGAAAACNSGPVVAGCTVDPVTGQCSTEGGECGPVVDACTNDADQATYDSLVYINDEGDTFTGTDAASEIGSDCIFGSTTDVADPQLDGCGDLALQVLACQPNCEPEVIQEAADCVADCTQTATGLSEDCMVCTGNSVACGAAFCTNVCIRDTGAPVCIDCRCANNCIQCTELCQGFPSDDECP